MTDPTAPPDPTAFPEPLLLVAPDGARAAVHPHGAHVTSWTPAGGTADERLFLSALGGPRPGAAIRGGIPVIFPQFAAEGPYARHGFARTSEWTVVEAGPAIDGAGAVLRLADTPATRAAWPFAFEATLTVALGGEALTVTLAVTNTGDAPMPFTAALHTYLRVAHVAEVAVHGLGGVTYRDATAGGAHRVEAADAVRLAGEVDRLYLDVPGPVEVREPGRATRVVAAGFPDVVLWNPGPERAAALADLEPGGADRFVCVEAAVVGRPVRLAPGERWAGAQTLVTLAER